MYFLAHLFGIFLMLVGFGSISFLAACSLIEMWTRAVEIKEERKDVDKHFDTTVRKIVS